MVSALTLALVLGAVLVDAQGPRGRGRAGFRALAASDAAGFAVPADMRRVAREARGASRPGLVERYRQFVGDAEVLGGQISVCTDLRT